MKKFFKSLYLVLAILAVLSIVLIGCGDDDADDNGGTTVLSICTPAETLTSMVSPDVDDPANGDTAEISGKTVTYNGSHWVYTVSESCVSLVGAVVIGDGVQLKINAGTTVVAAATPLSYLSIRPGAQIEAIGTATNPVVFTSGAAEGSRSSSDWGGIVIHGKAKCNTAAGSNTASDTEISTGSYGGDDNSDNSGTLQYVRIEFAGSEIAAGKEFNGLFLAGVGDGTTIDHIQVHRGSDDGIEIFGGTVSLSHAVITYNDDDGFDLDDGWSGHATHFVIARGSSIGDSMIEYDGLGKDHDRATQSFFSNFTFLGQGSGKKTTLINVKKNGALVIINSIFANFNDQYIVHQGEISDASPSATFFESTAIPSGYDAGANGYISSLRNNLLENCAISGTAATDIAALLSSEEDGSNTTSEWDDTTGNVAVASLASFTAPTSYWGENGAGDFAPSANPASPSPLTTAITDFAGNTMTPANYLGAVDAASNWLTGWTAFPEN